MHSSLSPLPIDPLIPEILHALREERRAVVVAPPGAGKTTRIPPAIVKNAVLALDSPNVILLQPRRAAARAAAARIAAEQDWQVGEEVGYQIRFDNRTSARTRLHVLTEGILTRRILGDPFLEGVGCVILDEFHERSIHTDLALALLREIQATVRENLAIVVMSATMNPGPVAQFLARGENGGRCPAPVFESPGRLFPVEITHLARRAEKPAWEAAAQSVNDILDGRSALLPTATSAAPNSMSDSDPGHVLVFLPGMGEIRRAEDYLKQTKNPIDADILMLHSSVASEVQDAVLRPSARRKVILATNIAETSLTIDGVRSVVDSGLARVPVLDARLGIDRLELRRISRASAAQRAGRAGRTAPGRCLRLWSRDEDTFLAEYETPEIHRIDLAGTLLTLKAYGVRDLARFEWFEPPRPEAMMCAERLLSLLGAVDSRGALTPIGRRMADLPLHPRLARMLLAGRDAGWLREAASLAALLSESSWLSAPPSERRVEARCEADSDVIERLEQMQTMERSSGAFCDGAKDSRSLAVSIARIRDDLVSILSASGREGGMRQKSRVRSLAIPEDANARERELRRLLLHAYPDRVTLRRENQSMRGVMVGGRGILLEPSSMVRKSPLFLSIDPREPSTPAAEIGAGKASGVQKAKRPGGARGSSPRQGDAAGTGAMAGESRVSMASAIEESWLGEVFPHLLETRMTHRYDPEREKVISSREITFAGLVIRSDAVGPGSDARGAAAALFEGLREGGGRGGGLEGLFAADEDAARWLRRVRFLARAMPELGIPVFDAESLGEVLRDACAGCTSLEQVRSHLRRRNLERRLSPRQRASLDEHAPEALAVPSGSRIRLEYPENPADPPVLAVRLQEVFGLADTPRLAGGRMAVLMHLLGPNFRPVQVTRDLRNFWNSTYQDVRKELRARYPKHPWPENPWESPPVAVGRKRHPSC